MISDNRSQTPTIIPDPGSFAACRRMARAVENFARRHIPRSTAAECMTWLFLIPVHSLSEFDKRHSTKEMSGAPARLLVDFGGKVLLPFSHLGTDSKSAVTSGEVL